MAQEAPEVVRVWSRCQRLIFRGLRSEPYNLPFFVRHSDLCDVLVTDPDGRPLACCRDLSYEAVDHCLVWLSAPCGMDSVCLYRSLEHQVPDEQSLVGLQTPEAVLLFADYFRCEAEQGSSAGDILARWALYHDGDAVPAVKRISLQGLNPLDDENYSNFEEDHIIDTHPPFGSIGRALCLNTVGGFLSLSHICDGLDNPDRLHVRAYFFDHGEEHPSVAHWLGLSTPVCQGAIGCSRGIDGCYSFLHDACPTGQRGEYHGWKRSGIDRSRGWHLFELIFERQSVPDDVQESDDTGPITGSLAMILDGEPVSTQEAHKSDLCSCQIRIVSRCGGVGVWAGVECLHTPSARNSWDSGVQQINPEEVTPWRILASEEGRWQEQDGRVQSIRVTKGATVRVVPSMQLLLTSFERVRALGYEYLPEMQPMLGNVYDVVELLPNRMVALLSETGAKLWFPPVALTLVKASTYQREPETQAREPSQDAVTVENSTDELGCVKDADETAEAEPELPPPPMLIGGIAIECWSIPGEEDAARVERVVTAFVEALKEAEVALPENIHRIEECPVPQHSGCFVYSFGTRRLHVATRTTQAGRLLLVVRCGGGFVDFIEFARRHGSLESLRLQRKQDASGRQVLRMTSVLTKGRVQLREHVKGSGSRFSSTF